MGDPGAELVDALRRAGVGRGDLVGCVVAPGLGVGLASPAGATGVATDDPAALVRRVDGDLRPRWVVWSKETAQVLVTSGARIATCWDLAAVHRLLVGGWRADPAQVWAHAQGLRAADVPRPGPVDLFSVDEHDADPDDPVRTDGHLRADWVDGAWSDDVDRLARWAELALLVAVRQHDELAAIDDRPMATSTARSESTAELLCAELEVDGLPFDRAVGERLVADVIGPRPRDEGEAAAQRARRDERVLRHAPAGGRWDLRSPGQVRSLLRAVGIEVPDTRAWRLEGLREEHPLVAELLVWRKAERVATTYGYTWIDEHVGEDGRLRGTWSGCDGAAGRMTASAGLHSLPADLRPAVVAEPGHLFVRADLGQIEPRVLAAVSGDPALARATWEDDMYARVAEQLGVDRPTAKVAVLGAMYGQTTGRGAQALRRLDAAYPVAMAHLAEADRAAQARRPMRTYGGRFLPMGRPAPDVDDPTAERQRAAARGRYGRNAVIQGAAAELFKVWAVIVRARSAALGATVVLCLHDELLVHAPQDAAPTVAALVDDALAEAAARWAPDASVRFVSATSVLRRWSDAH